MMLADALEIRRADLGGGGRLGNPENLVGIVVLHARRTTSPYTLKGKGLLVKSEIAAP